MCIGEFLPTAPPASLHSPHCLYIYMYFSPLKCCCLTWFKYLGYRKSNFTSAQACFSDTGSQSSVCQFIMISLFGQGNTMTCRQSRQPLWPLFQSSVAPLGVTHHLEQRCNAGVCPGSKGRADWLVLLVAAECLTNQPQTKVKQNKYYNPLTPE